MIDREWLDNLKVGDPVMIHWVANPIGTLDRRVPRSQPGVVQRLLVREIEILEESRKGHLFYGCRKTFKFRKSDGKRWPLNGYGLELWRIEKP